MGCCGHSWASEIDNVDVHSPSIRYVQSAMHVGQSLLFDGDPATLLFAACKVHALVKASALATAVTVSLVKRGVELSLTSSLCWIGLSLLTLTERDNTSHDTLHIFATYKSELSETFIEVSMINYKTTRQESFIRLELTALFETWAPNNKAILCRL